MQKHKQAIVGFPAIDTKRMAFSCPWRPSLVWSRSSRRARGRPRDIPPHHMPPLPQNPDIMGTVTVGSDRQKPTSHASALRNWGFLPGAAEVGFFRSYPDRTPHDSRGRNWGRSELNRESDTPKGTGQLPACELVGWLKIEAQGCTEGPTAVHIRSTRKGVKPNPSFLSMGKGAFG